ncbi:hypothetical protein O4H49_16775 [Kiloniella laminariae]|uniref:Smr domain-containing protein n=1 Tax=Kiloniella laminariae TaxID=454162 RepID=A0ABT4LMT4_9PROT|nr:hypothetical protein [Kiloniella laminariae]MCZ4282443.1 hypothetical protein [Kiloniella laminariae]
MDEVPLNFDHLIDRSGHAEYELNLTGLDLAHTLESIRRMIDRQRRRRGTRSVLIRLDPPVPGQGITLFRPVGQHLVELLKQGLIAKVKPYADQECTGFVIHLPSGKATDEETGPEEVTTH